MYIRIQPNCSLTPRELLTALGLIVGVSISIGTLFWFIGVPWILPFALLETILIAIAFIIHAKSLSDFDEITLHDGTLIVRQERKGQILEHRFKRGFFCVSMMQQGSAPIRIDESGRRVQIGEWLTPLESLNLLEQLRAISRY
jgi:uncharacterized membrane protein